MPLIKINKDAKSENDYVKIELSRDPTSEKSDLNEFKMALFDNSKSEYFLLFVWNLKIILEASGPLSVSTNIQYLCMLLHGEALHKVDTLSVEVVINTITHLNHIFVGLVVYFFPINALSKQNHTIRRVMRRPHELNLRCYTALMIYID